MVSASLFVLSLGALSALAAPSKRQSTDNGSCRALETQCAASVKSDLSDAWNHKACIFGATCFGGQRPVDGFLAAVYADRGLSGTAPTSVNLPRVTTSVFNSISTDGKTVTQQNFIDGYYSTLDATGGPYPDASYVIALFGNLEAWTAFCDAAIPFQNFADYFQYSSTVNSPGCGVSVTSRGPSLAPAPTTVTLSSSVQISSAVQVTSVVQTASAVQVTSAVQTASAVQVTSAVQSASAVEVTSAVTSASVAVFTSASAVATTV